MHPGTLAVAAIAVIAGVVSTWSLNLNLKWSQIFFLFQHYKNSSGFLLQYKIQLHNNI